MSAVMAIERSNQHMRRLDGELVYVDRRLEGWGKWAKQGVMLGYPAQSVYTKDRIIGSGPPPPEMPDHVLEVERAILKLLDIERQVVVQYYVRWEAREVMARRLHMSVNRFSRLLNRARWRVRDLLDGLD